MRLLRHPDTNPALIAWQGGSNYEFKLKEPDLVIKLWNGRSGKVTKSKDHFARSIRYHYTSGIIQATHSHHVYRCGPKAIDYFNQLGDEYEHTHT